MPTVTRYGCQLVLSDGLLPLRLLFLDALPPFCVGGSEDEKVLGVGVVRLSLSCRKLHWSPSEQGLFSFHW